MNYEILFLAFHLFTLEYLIVNYDLGNNRATTSLFGLRSNVPKCWDCFPALRFSRNDNFGLRKSC